MQKILLFLIIIFISILSFAQNNSNYIEGCFIIKISTDFKSNCKGNNIDISDINSYLNKIGANKIEKCFPTSKYDCTKSDLNKYDLSTIYEIKYTKNISLDEVIKNLSSNKYVEYVQPKYKIKPLYSPNDPNYNTYQYAYMSLIRANFAWDYTKGDTNMVIGIVDVGVNYSNSDLINNIAYNYADPINGIDDDNDGYIDNYVGWDMADGDNNPAPNDGTYEDHGDRVTALAAGTTDNQTGYASVGFKCKFLPVKVEDSDGNITSAYEGIVYAVNHGCKVVCCAWGSDQSYGQFGQDIINYAVNVKDAIVIAPVGNNSKNKIEYPANYENVLSVVATDNSDLLYSGSNYGYNADISAPGKNIRWNFVEKSGSSLSAGLVAGGAALLRTYFPSYSAKQIAELMKETSDEVDSKNTSYSGMLGEGRLNLYNALTKTNIIAVEMYDVTYKDNTGDLVFSSGDYVNISAKFTNYLSPIDNLTLTITTNSPYITMISQPNISVGAITTNETVSVSDFVVLQVLPNAPQNEKVVLKFELKNNSETYTDVQYETFVLNQDYINISTNKITTTLTNYAKIGYNNYPFEGEGFKVDNKNSILTEAGFMISDSTNKVSNNIGTDSSFNVIETIRRIVGNDTLSNFDVYSKFSDDSAKSENIGVNIIQKAYKWNDENDENFILITYDIINKSETVLNDVYAGIYADWNIGMASHNAAMFDSENLLGYIMSFDGDGYAGIKLCSNTPIKCYSIGGVGGINISDGFSKSEKYRTLTTSRNEAGNNGYGYDVMHVVSTGPFNNVNIGDTINLAFALVTGANLVDLQKNAMYAQVRYNNLYNNIENIDTKNLNVSVFPNPSNGSVYINSNANINSITIINIFGQPVKVEKNINNKTSVLNISDLNNGIYFLTIESDNSIITKKIIKQ